MVSSDDTSNSHRQKNKKTLQVRRGRMDRCKFNFCRSPESILQFETLSRGKLSRYTNLDKYLTKFSVSSEKLDIRPHRPAEHAVLGLTTKPERCRRVRACCLSRQLSTPRQSPPQEPAPPLSSDFPEAHSGITRRVGLSFANVGNEKPSHCDTEIPWSTQRHQFRSD